MARSCAVELLISVEVQNASAAGDVAAALVAVVEQAAVRVERAAAVQVAVVVAHARALAEAAVNCAPVAAVAAGAEEQAVPAEAPVLLLSADSQVAVIEALSAAQCALCFPACCLELDEFPESAVMLAAAGWHCCVHPGLQVEQYSPGGLSGLAVFPDAHHCFQTCWQAAVCLLKH